MAKRLACVAIVLAGMISLGAQSTGPVLNNLVDGSSTVSGKAAPGSAPIAIYDLSFETKTKIGQANATADDGAFSTTVRPPLVKGHQIVAIDSNGNAGRPVSVE